MKHKLFFLLCAMFFCGTIHAQSVGTRFTSGNLRYEVLTETTVSVYNTATSLSGAVSVPETVTYNSKTYTVTEIAANAFSLSTYCKNIKAITLPSTVTVIGAYAFSQCSLSDSLVVKGAITSIGNNAFKSGITIGRLDIYDQESWWNASFGSTLSNPICFCTNLYCKGKPVKSLYINMTDIPANAFENCVFNTVIIGPTVKTIGSGSFGTIYKTIWLPNVVPSGSPNAAEGKINYCSSTVYTETTGLTASLYNVYPLLTSRFEVDGVIYALLSNNTDCDVIDCNYSSDPIAVNIGSSVTYKGHTFNVRNINDYACYDDDCITGDIIVANQGYVGKYAFYNCNKATGDINLTNTGSIGDYAFYGCSKAAGSITANNGGDIGKYAFSGCSLASSGEITNQGNIENNAFQNCSGLTTLTISNQGYIGTQAFTSCTGLEDLTVSNNGEIKREAFKSCNITNSATIANNGHIRGCAFYQVGGSFTADINNKGSLADSTFYGSTMKSLTIGSDVTTIGSHAFYSSSVTNEATINNSGEISEYAFASMTGYFIADIKCTGILPASCFASSNLSTVTIGNSVTTIAESCFSSSVFSTISIGSSVHTIKKNAFKGATGFTTIILPNNVVTLEEYAFQNCTSMENITLSRGLSEILEGTFSGCSKLSELNVVKEINTIGDFVFNNCTALKTFIFEDKSGNYNLGIGGTTSAQTGLFKTCGLDSVYVGGALIYATTSPTYSPFYQNVSLRSIRFTDKENKIYPREFYGCTKLENIWMGPTIDDVGSYAFSGCTSLKKVTVGPAVVQLGAYSFNGCTALMQIDLANVVTIKNNTFQNCTSLPQINIPLSITSIENQAFKSCSSLKNIIIEDRTAKLMLGINSESTNYKGITGAGTPIFSDCPLDSVYIGGPIDYSKTLSSGYSPFFYNESLRSVYITNKEKRVYTNEFYNCLGLQRIKLGDGVIAINDLGFQSCTGLLYFEFAPTLQSIGADAFSDCNNINTIISHATIPPTVGDQGLEDINFWECTLYVPDGSESAYQEADQWRNFFDCRPIKLATGITLDKTEISFSEIEESITLIATVVPSDVMDGSVTWTSSDPAVATVDNNGVVTSVSFGSATITAKTADGTNLTATCTVTVAISPLISFVDSSVKTLCVANWDTNGNGELSQAEAAAVTDLGDVFKNNTQITSFDELKYFTGLTSIASEAFSGCSGLTSVTIPESVTTIGSGAFSGCTGLTKAEFSGIEDLCGIVFENVEANPLSYAHHLYVNGEEVTELTIPNSVTSIGQFAFRGSGLTSVTIPNSVTEIGLGAFAYCTALSSVSLPNGITEISRGLFAGCTSLTTIIIPESVTSIGQNAFQESGLTSIVIPNSVTTLGGGAFELCSSLTSLSIGSGLKDLRNNYFYLCMNLTKVEFASIEDLCNIDFSGRFNSNNPLYYAKHLYINGEEVTDLVIPNSVTQIGVRTFINCSSITSVTIPESITSIASNAFSGCSGITTVKIYKETPPSCPFSSYANAILYVPVGCKAAYEAADYWKGFLQIKEFIEGDVNMDGETDVVDVVDIARYVVGTPAETFVPILADINNSGDVNIGDAVTLVNNIAGDQNFSRAMYAPKMETDSEETLTLNAYGENALSLALQNNREYTAFQFDLYVPEGTDVMQMQINKERKQKHQLLYNKVEDGHWRVVALSTSNNTFQGNDGELLNVALGNNSSEGISLSNIMLFDAKGTGYPFNDLYLSGTTMIQSMGDGQWTTDDSSAVYDLQGRKIVNGKSSSYQLPRGVYIMNGKKVVIK